MYLILLKFLKIVCIINNNKVISLFITCFITCGWQCRSLPFRFGREIFNDDHRAMVMKRSFGNNGSEIKHCALCHGVMKWGRAVKMDGRNVLKHVPKDRKKIVRTELFFHSTAWKKNRAAMLEQFLLQYVFLFLDVFFAIFREVISFPFSLGTVLKSLSRSLSLSLSLSLFLSL